LIIAGLGVIGCLIYTYYLKNGAESKDKRKIDETKRTLVADCIFLAAQNFAILDWQKHVSDKGDGIFSADLAKALIQQNGQPVILVMNLQAVAGISGNNMAKFTSSGSLPDNYELTLEAILTTYEANVLGRNGKGQWGKDQPYAVVARITEVSKVDSPNVTDTNSFVAKGECLDFIKIDLGSGITMDDIQEALTNSKFKAPLP
jgi:hypothetical protein